MEKKKFVGFGEIMVRLAPAGVLRFPQADSFTVNYTGAEGNMAIALAYMGMPAEMVTKFPDNDIGRCAYRMLRKYDVLTDHIAWGGERLGLYYLERGASQRPSKVIYDRKHSSIAEAVPEDFDWDDIFKDAGWFHFTGITVALSKNMQEICRQACVAAKRHGVKISCDLNYRKNLWSTEEANPHLNQLPIVGLGGNPPGGEGNGIHGTDAGEGADDMQQSCQIIGPHIHQRPGTGLIEKIGVRVPGLHTLLEKVCRGSHHPTDGTGIHQMPGSLDHSTKGHVRRTAKTYPFFPRQSYQFCPLSGLSRQGLFAVHMLTGLQSRRKPPSHRRGRNWRISGR